MAAYTYKGLHPNGRSAAGVVDAENPRRARAALRDRGVYPTEVLPAIGGIGDGAAGGRRIGNRLAPADLALITRQWATLLSAGIPLLSALSALAEQVEDRTAKQICSDLREGVREGMSVTAALSRHPDVFSPLYRQMVRAGEASGTLDQMLVRLADHLEAQHRLAGQIVTALAYPVLMLVLSLLILIFILTFVVPKVTAVFVDMGQALPLPTRILLAVSRFLGRWGWLTALFCAAGLFAMNRWRKADAGKRRHDRWILSLPVAGRALRLVAVSRCARTLATLLAGGAPLLTALEIAQQVIGNRALEEALGAARLHIREGEGIAGPLKMSGLFPPMAIHMIATGEKSGQLDAMLEKIAEACNREVETTLTRATALLSPLLILGMGGIVFFIVLAVLLPIFEISHQIR